MEYSKKSNYEDEQNKNLQVIPFEYDISEAGIDSECAEIILSPLRIEPKIEGFKLTRNVKFFLTPIYI